MFGYIDVDKEITGNYGEDSCGEEVVACTYVTSAMSLYL